MRPRAAFVLVSTVLLLSAIGRPAFADFPSPGNSTIPAVIRLVGADVAGAPDPAGAFVVTFRDLANNPIAGANIDIDFGAATDVALCANQPPGVTRTALGARAVTDASGVATFTLYGRCVAGPPTSPLAVKIFADGILLGSVRVAAFDYDGANGVNGSDLSAWLTDFVNQSPSPRGDYDGNGIVGGSDLSLWAAVFLQGSSARSCP